METRSRNIQRWMDDVKCGAIRLPRFQREEVWTSEHVKNFLWAILQDRPLGVFLVLEVDGNQQPFKTLPLAGAPDNGEPCKQHLLDGQQRLTALWKSFNNNHDSHVFFVTFDRSSNEFGETGVEAVSKRGRDKERIGKPLEEFEKGWVPIEILAPGEEGLMRSYNWCEAVSLDEFRKRKISMFVQKLRERMIEAIIPYLSLPQSTSPTEAIQIFIETNRSSVRLSDFDIAVAQMESKTEESLREMIDDLTKKVPVIESLEGSNTVGDLVLKVQCILENKKPTYGNYRTLDFDVFKTNWDNIVNGIKWATELLEDMLIWDSQRLPSSVPLRVLPALYCHIPQTGTDHAKAIRLIKKYLWWSFLTDRYERQANDRLKEDFDTLVDVLQGNKDESDVPVFKCHKPTKEDIKAAGWPTARGILSRAILVACSLGGAKDIASNRPLRKGRKLDHHHVFPKGVLKTNKKDPNLALNCMLLEPLTNKEWAKKWPGDYLIEMVNASGNSWPSPEREVENRLETHLLPAQNLIPIKEIPKADIGKPYDTFLDSRAKQVMMRIKKLLNDGELE